MKKKSHVLIGVEKKKKEKQQQERDLLLLVCFPWGRKEEVGEVY